MTTAATLTLTDFLLARIAEDEAAARAVNTGQWYPWDSRNGDLYAALRSLNTKAAAHIARHDPARVLAECAAKKRIVKREILRYCDGLRPDEFISTEVGEQIAARADSGTLRDLAIIYSDHPDYCGEWAL